MNQVSELEFKDVGIIACDSIMGFDEDTEEEYVTHLCEIYPRESTDFYDRFGETAYLFREIEYDQKIGIKKHPTNELGYFEISFHPELEVNCHGKDEEYLYCEVTSLTLDDFEKEFGGNEE